MRVFPGAPKHSLLPHECGGFHHIIIGELNRVQRPETILKARLTVNAAEDLKVDDGKRRIGMLGRRGRLTRHLDTVAAFLEAHPWAIFAIIGLLYLVYLATHATARRLWHDELFTYYIAQAPTFGQMLQQTRTVDLNPPLYYIAARAVFKFLHPSDFAVRLPSMAAFLLAAFCVYSLFADALPRSMVSWRTGFAGQYI